jgi:hypothetical protein
MLDRENDAFSLKHFKSLILMECPVDIFEISKAENITQEDSVEKHRKDLYISPWKDFVIFDGSRRVVTKGSY